jgi:electron transport complex protein RnfD
MALPHITSPHSHANQRTQQIMLQVVLATVPGVLALTWLFGFGSLINLLLASLFALGFEAAILAVRQRSMAFYLTDGSALVTGVLLALALPPYAPWWLTLVAVGFAITFGKQLYGGLGQNPFNPAMLGYVVVLISFPLHMTSWPEPHSVGLFAGLGQIFGFAPLPDGWSQATALDALKLNKSLTMDELWATHPAFGQIGGNAVEWVNGALLLGGLYLWQKKLISWHAPIGMLAALSVLSLLFYNGSGSDSNGSPLFHLFTGATMLGAFFIVTDPVSGATSNLGRIIFGAGVGTLTYIIRTWGGYPDGVAFAVLLMNLAAPTIDYYSRPRSYGHRKAERGFKLGE